MTTTPIASAASAAARAGEFTVRYRWYVLSMLVVAYIFNFIDRSILAILQEPIKHDLGLKDWQLGLMSGFAFAVFYATLGIPIARLADRWSRTKIIGLAVLVWSLMTALCGFAVGFWSLLLFRIGVGVGEAGCSPPAHSLISDLFEPAKRATALATYSIGIQIGVMLGLLAGGWINEWFGWREAFYIVGLPGVLFSFLLLGTLREPPRGLAEGRSQAAASLPMPGLFDVFRLLWSRRSFRHLSFGGALHAFVAYGVGGWIPPFFIRTHGFGTGELSTYLALLAGTIGTAGIFLGGFLGDRWARRDQRWYCWICSISLVLSLPFSTAAYLQGNGYAALACYLVPAFLSPVYNAPTYAMTQSLVPLRMRAAAAAVLLFILNMIGMGLGPSAVGLLSDALNPTFGRDALRYALLVTMFVNLWAAAHYLFAARTLREELRAAELT